MSTDFDNDLGSLHPRSRSPNLSLSVMLRISLSWLKGVSIVVISSKLVIVVVIIGLRKSCRPRMTLQLLKGICPGIMLSSLDNKLYVC
jgi:hypothetical protein